MGHTSLLFHGQANDIFVAYSALLAMLLGGGIVRWTYHLTHNKGAYSDYHTHLAVKGMKFLKILSLITFFVITGLLARVDVSMTKDWFHPDSFNTGYWCIIRLTVGFFFAFAAYLFDTHPYFRVFCMLACPILAAMDMISQNSFARQIQCIEREICAADPNINSYYAQAWRDIASCGFFVLCGLLSWWLTAISGFCTNQLYLPKKEHRMLSQ